jgi:hypothetical protein
MSFGSNIIATIKRPNLIVANSVPLTTTQSNPPVELKNSITGVGQSYLHNLLDVVEDHPSDGATLVYNANTHKYEVKTITVAVTALDGGTF